MTEAIVAIAGHVQSGCTLLLVFLAGYVVQLVIRRWLEIRRNNGGSG